MAGPELIIEPQRMSFEELLIYQDGTDTCYELVRGELQPMALGTARHDRIVQYLDNRFNANIQATTKPWISQRFTVGIQSPRGNRWDTCRIPDITVLTLAQWDDMDDREAVIRVHEPPPCWLLRSLALLRRVRIIVASELSMLFWILGNIGLSI